MKKIILLFAFVAIASFSYGQAQKYLNFGGAGTGLYVGWELPVSTAIAIVPQVSTDYNFDKIVISAKGNYYLDEVFGVTEDWDTYAGVNLGWRIDNLDNNDSGFAWGIHIGGRWFWSEKWGLNAEFGGGSGVTGGIGVTMKL